MCDNTPPPPHTGTFKPYADDTGSFKWPGTKNAKKSDAKEDRSTQYYQPQINDIVVSLCNPRYKRTMHDYFKRIGYDQLSMNRVKEIAKEILNDLIDGSNEVEPKFFKQNQQTKKHYVVNEQDALKSKPAFCLCLHSSIL